MGIPVGPIISFFKAAGQFFLAYLYPPKVEITETVYGEVQFVKHFGLLVGLRFTNEDTTPALVTNIEAIYEGEKLPRLPPSTYRVQAGPRLHAVHETGALVIPLHLPAMKATEGYVCFRTPDLAEKFLPPPLAVSLTVSYAKRKPLTIPLTVQRTWT